MNDEEKNALKDLVDVSKQDVEDGRVGDLSDFRSHLVEHAKELLDNFKQLETKDGVYCGKRKSVSGDEKEEETNKDITRDKIEAVVLDVLNHLDSDASFVGIKEQVSAALMDHIEFVGKGCMESVEEPTSDRELPIVNYQYKYNLVWKD